MSDCKKDEIILSKSIVNRDISLYQSQFAKSFAEKNSKLTQWVLSYIKTAAKTGWNMLLFDVDETVITAVCCSSDAAVSGCLVDVFMGITYYKSTNSTEFKSGTLVNENDFHMWLRWESSKVPKDDRIGLRSVDTYSVVYWGEALGGYQIEDEFHKMHKEKDSSVSAFVSTSSK